MKVYFYDRTVRKPIEYVCDDGNMHTYNFIPRKGERVFFYNKETGDEMIFKVNSIDHRINHYHTVNVFCERIK